MTCKSVALFAALVTPFATVAHLASEAASLGARSPRVLLEPEHAYLAVLNAVAILVLVFALGIREGSAERRRRIALLVSALPGRGRGLRFLGSATLAQLVFFAVTELAEGDPMSHGRALLGVLAAILASVVGALVVAACKMRILRILASINDRLPAPVESRPVPFSRIPVTALAQRLFLSLSVANRPPPLSAT